MITQQATKTTLAIDQQLAEKQLQYLGYNTTSKICFRAFFDSKDPRKTGDKGRKLDRLDWQTLNQWQAEGRGIYLTINHGGHCKEEIQSCVAIFCEWDQDQLDLALQLEHWKKVGFFEPTFSIFSGNKSHHCYWVFRQPIDPNLWTEMQAKLIKLMNADPVNRDASRVFRLAGAFHPITGLKSIFSGESGQIYSAEELAKKLDQLLAPSQKPIQKNSPISSPISISLTVCLSRENRANLHGVSTNRNASMFRLAQDLIGVEQEFVNLGQTASDNAKDLFLNACQSCRPGDGWGAQEWESIWVSAKKRNNGPTLNQEFLMNCIKGEIYRQNPTSNYNFSSPVLEKKTAFISPPLTNNNEEIEKYPENTPKWFKDYQKVEKLLGDRLRLNNLTKNIELDGQPLKLERAKIQLAQRFGLILQSGSEDVEDILIELSEKNAYHPIKEYLQSNFQKNQPKETNLLNNLAQKYFGLGGLFNIFVKKTLMGAVARIFNPGSKVDTALILQGPQGTKKSSFYKELCGVEWFDDSLGSMSDKDEKLKLHQCWFMEWAELESVFRRKDVANTKQFLSSGVDVIRPPYGRNPERFPRQSIIVGTTNQTEFLSDSTGNRRFWVVPIKKMIDIGLLRKERDQIWAEAVHAYLQGESWFLNSEEETQAEGVASEFASQDPWENAIIKWIESRDYVTISEILTSTLEIELGRQTKGDEMRVADILKKIGWTSATKTINGKRAKIWRPKINPVDTVDTVDTSSPTFQKSAEVAAENGVFGVSNPLDGGFYFFEKGVSTVSTVSQPPHHQWVHPVDTLSIPGEVSTADVDTSPDFDEVSTGGIDRIGGQLAKITRLEELAQIKKQWSNSVLQMAAKKMPHHIQEGLRQKAQRLKFLESSFDQIKERLPKAELAYAKMRGDSSADIPKLFFKSSFENLDWDQLDELEIFICELEGSKEFLEI